MKTKKKIWIISFLCVGAGVILLILGMILGGLPGFYIDDQGLHSYADAAKKPAYVSGEKELAPFTSANIDLDYADLQIVPSDTFKIEYCMEGRKKPVCTVDNGMLTLKEADYKRVFSVDYFSFGSVFSDTDVPDSYVKLYVPKGTAFDSIQILNDDGDVQLAQLTADTLRIEADYGDVSLNGFEGTEIHAALADGSLSIKNSKADQIEIADDYGDITLKDTECNTLDADLSDGDLTAGNLSCETADIENEYGDVSLRMAGVFKDYSFDLTTEYGDIQIPEYDVISGDDEARCQANGSSGKKVQIYCEDGDIEIFAGK